MNNKTIYSRDDIEQIFNTYNFKEIEASYSKTRLVEMHKIVYDGLKPASSLNKTDIINNITNYFVGINRTKIFKNL